MIVTVRNRLRTNPVARWLYLRWMAGQNYEDRFGKQMLAAIDSRSVVWDVGANIGLYTQQFLARGAREVVCFEPAPAAVLELETRFADEARVHVCPVALADSTSSARFVARGADPTNRIASPHPGTRDETVEVPVRRGDDVAAELTLSTPTLVKVDVEGYEWEVLTGLGALLERAHLRHVFVEVHFSILHERGLDEAPARIVALLEKAGFVVRWLDLSHIEASRAQTRGKL
jgi:FkbM family methyltransferase